MSHLHDELLSPDQVRDLVLPLVRRSLLDQGFRGLTIKEEVDFDGVDIIRVTAEVDQRVDARRLIDLNDDLQLAVRAKGDSRFVFLRTRRPGDDPTDGDEE